MTSLINSGIKKRCQIPKEASKSDAFPGRNAQAAKKVVPESSVKKIK